MKAIIKANRFLKITFIILSLLYYGQAIAQETTLVQVKTFDIDLNVIPNLQFSFDEIFYFATEDNGSTIVEISADLLPPKVIYFKDIKLEPESWNYSKGILEIIVRKKLYEVYNLTFIDDDGLLLRNIAVRVETEKPVEEITNNAGYIQIALPVDLDLLRPSLFNIKGYNIVNTDLSGNTGRIIASIIPPTGPPNLNAASETSKAGATFSNTQLDSLRTLPVFWAFVSGIDLTSLTPSQELQIDNKFSELLLVYKDSIPVVRVAIISDSSLVSNDILYLTEQVILERQAIIKTREDINNELTKINDKVVDGGSNLSDEEREKLLVEINKLDKLLLDNESQFEKNQEYYKSSINDLKSSLLNIENLEKQLSVVEQQRQIEKKQFRKSLFIALGISLGLLFLVILFVYLTRKITKQKKALVVAHDEVKEINNNLEFLVAKRTKTLQRVNTELDTFLYRSSHDLKRPLSSILGLANIAKITLNDEANALFEKTRETANDMDRLLQKLITISQINYPEADSEINFQNLVERLKEEFKDQIDKKKAEVTYIVPEEIAFKSNSKLVECILRNLIDNALFYSSLNSINDPKVEVSISVKDHYLELSINDNGAGISEEIEGKVWNMFYRGNESSAGNGLGLYISKRAVIALNGEISFETEVGEYTTFNVSIPPLSQKTKKINKVYKKEVLELT